jgi:hypothetical protein
MEFFMLMIAPFLVAGASLLFLFIWFSRGNDKSIE